MLKSCPGSVDVSELQFKLQCRLKTFENEDFSSFPNANSLLSCASRYGLLFVGSNSNHFQVIQTQTLHSYGSKDKNVADYPRRNIEIPSLPKHLCVNCDSTLLAVVVEKDQCPIVIFYEVLSFLHQNVNVIKEIRLSSTPNVYVREINWNPSLPAIFTACKSDGSLGVYELKGESVDINELPAAAGATCFCWSPKGKQIAVGSKDGKITQYKPDLKAVKAIGEPKLEGPHTIINLQWVSNYQFIGVYQSVQTGASYIIVVDAPKTGEPSYTNYDDICYSGSSRPPQFYLILQQTWNFLMIGSANSAEVGVLGSNGESWIQWIMADTGRAELPLSLDHQETLPVGLTFDTSSTTPLPWGESSIPPCPILCVLSHQGVLCCFNVVYLKEGIPSVCTPPDPVGDTSGLSTFITSSASKKNVTEIAPPKPQSSSEIKFGVTDTQLQTNSTPAKDGLFSFPSASTALNIQHQSTPLVTAKSSADSVPKTLFGGQATLTPIKPQQPSQGMPLFGGQTLITPISKGPNGTVPSTNSATNFTGKYGSIFSSVQPTSAPQSSAVPVKPIVISASSVKPEATKLPEAAAKPQVIAPKTHVSTPKEAQRSIAKPEPQIDNKAETSAMLSQMIRDEWMYLETELKVLLNSGRGVKVNVGTDKEKVDMVEKIASLQEFVKEAVDISVGQSSEIHFLKQNLIQSWAWFEEAKSHYNASKNEAVTLLIKLQPLDSLSQKRLRDIEQLIYYVESQLSQASKALDEQWDNFQDYAKKTHKVKMPTMEAIFQTMVSQNAVLQKHTYTLKDISMRLRRKTSNMNSLLLSFDKGRDLADDFHELRLDPQNILQLQYEKIKNHTKNLSETKAKKLRNLLSQREVTRVTAIKPQLSSWTINQSPASRMRQSISKLGSSMSSVARNLDFIQSPSVKTLEVTQPVQLTQFSIKTPEKPTLATTPNAASAPTSFFPLVKSGPVISSSQGSAFTPIGGAATSIAASDKQQQLFKSSASPMPSFSFGAAPNKSVAKITSSSSSEALTSSTAVVTTASSKFNFSVAGGIFKSASETATVKPQPAPTTSTFAFVSGGAVPKSIFGTPTSSLSSNNSFQISTASSNSAFGSLTNLNKPNVLANAVSPSQNVKKTVTTTAATDSAASTPKPTSGVASIFANIQSVIDKATSSTTADSSKPAISFSTTSSAVTTTTQSVFGSFTASSTAGSFFGSISKPAADSATSPGLFGVAPNSSSTSIFGQPTKVAEASSSASDVTTSSTASESVKTTESKPETTNVITVSLFGSKPTTAASTVTSTTTSIFAPQSNTNIFGASTAPSSTAQGDVTPSAPSVFETPKATAPITSSTVTTTASTSIFGSPSQSSTIFGSSPTSTTAPNIFATNTTATTGSVFGTSATPASGDGGFGPPTTSIFGSPAQSKSIFGSSTTTTNTTTPAFGSTATSDFGTPATSAFGTPAASTATSVFGAPAATTATSTFGTPAASTAASAFGAPANIFGSPTPSNAFEAPTTKPSLFGSPATGSIFGAAPPGTSANIFASPTTAAFGTAATTTSTSIFGSPTTTTSSSPFGSSTTGSVQPFGSQSGSIFGATNTSGNTFGQPAAFGSQTTPFGGAQPTTASSIFGQPSAFGAAASQSSSVFGSGTTAASTSGNIFGSAAAAPSSGFGSGFGTTPTTNAFGSPAATQSSAGSFGFGGLSVGATSSSESIFGGNSGGAFNQTPNANPFGKVEAKPAFGSSSSNIFGNTATTPATTNAFGSPASTASSIFGSSSSGATFGSSTAGGAFGSPSAFGGTSTFGQKPAFGQPAPFGGTAFGSPQAGAFSGGAASPVAQSGFGSPASFQKPGFGSAPIFGGSPAPAFGASPSFGGTASFGSAPAFGTPEKVFGATQPASGGFTASAPQNAGFGNIASQNTIGFGNLAQQANTSTSMPFSGNSSFSSWR